MEITIFRVVLQILVSLHQVVASSCKYLRASPIVDRTQKCAGSNAASSMDEGDAAFNNSVINSVSPHNAMRDASMASPWQFSYSPKQVVKSYIHAGF